MMRNYRGNMRGLGELPDVPLDAGGALNLAPPLNRPPLGTLEAPSMQGGMIPLAHNQSSWAAIPFTATTTPKRIQDFLYRKFFLIQNRGAAGTIYVGVGYVPTPENALILPAGVSYEPFAYPTNDIWVVADAGTVSGLLIYGV